MLLQSAALGAASCAVLSTMYILRRKKRPLQWNLPVLDVIRISLLFTAAVYAYWTSRKYIGNDRLECLILSGLVATMALCTVYEGVCSVQESVTLRWSHVFMISYVVADVLQHGVRSTNHILLDGALLACACLYVAFRRRLGVGIARGETMTPLRTVLLEDPPVFVPNNEYDAPLLSKWTFWWMTKLIHYSQENQITRSCLPPLRNREAMKYREDVFNKSWNETPRIVYALYKSIRFDVYTSLIMKVLFDLLTFTSPLILKSLISHIENQGEVSHGIILACALFGTIFLQSMSLHRYFRIVTRAGMNVRSSLVQAVYTKTLRLPKGQAEAGKTVNHINTDAQKLQDICTYGHVLWSAPLQITLAITELYMCLGVSIFGGVAVMLSVIVMNNWIMAKLRVLQKEIAAARDRRSNYTLEMLKGVRPIKLHGWEAEFEERITAQREEELRGWRNAKRIGMVLRFVFNMVPILVTLVTLYVYIYLGNTLTASTLFTSVALFSLLRFPMMILPSILTQVSDSRVSARRLEDFLKQQESNPRRVLPPPREGEASIDVEHLGATWGNGISVVQDLSFKAYPGSLTMIVGRTGTGKSALLDTLLGDVVRTVGVSNIYGSVAFVPQSSWIRHDTIRGNILFNSQYDPVRYASVIRACGLRADLDAMPDGDKTEIGSKGVNISGGQKQRISLAQAVYKDADVYLLDDCLSAVDANLASEILDGCLRGILKEKTIVLVTHKLQFLPYASQVIYFRSPGETVIASYEEVRTFPDFQEFAESIEIDDDVRGDPRSRASTREEDALVRGPSIAETRQLVVEETSSDRRVPLKTYYQYIKYSGGIPMWFVYTSILFANYQYDVWGVRFLSDWTTPSKNISNQYGIAEYSYLNIMKGLLIVLSAGCILIASQWASRAFHLNMLRATLKAPLSFFESTPSGRILNRYTKDMTAVDDNIPRTIADLVTVFFRVVVVVYFVVYATPTSVAVLVPLFVYYIDITKSYGAAAQQLQRLDNVLRSPLNEHMSETFDGIQVIRAFQVEGNLHSQNSGYLEIQQRAYNALISSHRWLALRIEMLANCLTFGAALLAVTTAGVTGGTAGASLSLCVGVTQTVNWLVRQVGDLMAHMVCVERIMEYTEDVPHESRSGRAVGDKWPTRGLVEFERFTLKYRQDLPPALDDISLLIEPGEKIGIVGRSGAGKTSLVAAILRLVERWSGHVYIDGIPVDEVTLPVLRHGLTVIPQDPVIFKGSLRFNIDPLMKTNDKALWEVVRRAHLEDLVQSRGGTLDLQMEEHNVSVGERQLICLARALANRSKILILDEATSSVDVQTDAMIQETIRSEFTDVTILTIAHRLDTIRDYNRVILMNAGKIVESGKPSDLLNDPNSKFKSLWDNM